MNGSAVSGRDMRIQIEYFDGSFDFVEADRLDALIASRRIVAFKRKDGWVRVPYGPLRGQGGKSYEGSDRRGKGDK
jgi:hypothetical protein